LNSQGDAISAFVNAIEGRTEEAQGVQ
jgi:hypothetical protein